jgi:hypothetical protein
MSQCLQDLRVTDPVADMHRIKSTKDTLLKDCYAWILNDQDLQCWQSNNDSRLLWINGEPGKGKTMLMIALVHELREGASSESFTLAFFFCQSTESTLNSVDSVLRGIIWMLVHEHPHLAPNLIKEYKAAGKQLFEGTAATSKLWLILSAILNNPAHPKIYILIDAVDECDTGWDQLLQFITENAADPASKAKWLISSRNYPKIQQLLKPQDDCRILSLEMNSLHVSQAVDSFIDYKVYNLEKRNNNDEEFWQKVNYQLKEKAGSTFLWAALVLKELEAVESWDVLEVLQEMPSGLQPLYSRMMRQIQDLRRKDSELCCQILSTVTLTQRPLHLLELGAISNLPRKISCNLINIAKIVNQCGSFLTIREYTVYIIHQSAKEFLVAKEASGVVFPSGKSIANFNIFSQSLQVMSSVLRRDIYSLKAPGITIDQVKQPNPDPLATVRYYCLYWVDHLLEYQKTEGVLKDSGLVYSFLRQSFLYWLEALSLMKCVSDGITMIRKLESLQVRFSTKSYKVIGRLY